MIIPYPLVRKLLFALPPETAHRASLVALRLGLAGRDATPDPPSLATTLWGLDFANPIGLAAGYDKDAEAPDALFRLGFGFVELGTVTPRAQSGNPRPRLFRLTEDRAVINRLGFNGGGLEAFAGRLSRRVGRTGIVGVNLGRNRNSADADADYESGVRRTAALADYLVVNVSSPNTPGLRDLQQGAALRRLVDRLAGARGGDGPPLLVKLAPDLDPGQRGEIAAVALAGGIDGLIIGNTTVSRPETLASPHKVEAGGLSGRPLMALSTEVLADFYRLTGGRLPLIGCGGVASGADAYAKIRAGASLVQIYTALVYDGPAVVGDIKRSLAALLVRDGFASVGEAVGADQR